MINKNLFILLIISVLYISNLYSQQKTYKVGCIGFYNFENLFDTENDPIIRDDEFTPNGSNRWTDELYKEKLDRLAYVVWKLGLELTPDGASILGIAEIENKKVLEDFVNHPKLKDRNYQIVHYDSPDRRGIDVALIYQPKYFTVESSMAIPLVLYEKDSSRVYTRDILSVSGQFDGEPLTVLVNHWPSRRGGQKATQPFRNAGANLCKSIVDSLCAANPNNKVIGVGRT